MEADEVASAGTEGVIALAGESDRDDGEAIRGHADGSAPERAPTPFGSLVRSWRRRQRMSQKRLASLANVSPGYVALIENGSRGKRPSRDVVIGLAQALAAPVDEFLRAAGRLTVIDEAVYAEVPRFDAVVRSDPLLRAEQKRILIDIYRSWVGREATV
jgi:transcriptional regulator with XRE-family HTH domain